MKTLLDKYSFLLAALILIVFETSVMLKGRWAGDFWEHSAVVNELSKNLVHPANPIIKSDIPHAFFSPYSVTVALFSKLSGLNSIEALTVFGFLNLIFLLTAIYLFCKALFKENANLIAALSLLLILLFWGGSPFMWSGFFHFFILHLVLPYPSTFAFALSLMSLALLAKAETSHLKTALLSLMFSVVVITHPPTAVFLSCGILALSFSFSLNWIRSLIIMVGGFTLCFLWPYYDIMSLILDNNIDFSNDSKKLYVPLFDTIHRYWPAVLAIPALLFIKKDRAILFLFIAIVLMKLIYMAGFVFKIYSVSRVISDIMILCSILIAYTAILLIKEQHKFAKHYFITLVISFLISVYFNRAYVSETLSLLNDENVRPYEKYEFLKTAVTDTDLILSDESTNAFIPSFGGRVLASHTPLYWLPDHHERREAVYLFFKKECPDEERLLILKKYKPDYILIDATQNNISNLTLKLLYTISESSKQYDQFNLIKLKP